MNAHLCGESCKLSDKQGCLEECTKVSLALLSLSVLLNIFKVAGHKEEDHMCAASVHTCGEVS